MRAHPRVFAVLLVLLLAVPAVGKSVDLGREYKATLDWEEGALGRTWTAGPEDVYTLSGWRFSFRGDLQVEIGPSTLVIGHHETNAVWAAILPDEPGTIVTKAGGKEPAATVWLRFHPKLVKSLFPKKTVTGRGPSRALIPALRLMEHRMNDWCQAEFMPVIPQQEWMLVDTDTSTGRRHMMMLNTKEGTAKDLSDLKPVPPPYAAPISKEDALKAFDDAFKAFDEEYPMFGLRPEVDWEKLRDIYRPVAAEAETAYEAAGAINLLVRHLRDLHVHVQAGGVWLPGFGRMRMLNAHYDSTKRLVGFVNDLQGKDISWGKTDDGIGYVNVWKLARTDLPDTFDGVLGQLGDTWGLVLDLRFNGGGGEDLAMKIAGRFLDEERIYSTNRYRAGPNHDQFGPVLERKCGPRGPWRYESPVMVLVGRKTMSSAESFALMLAQCPQAVLVGDRTAGSSANPRRLSLSGGITVNLPTWLDMTPDGEPIDEKGVVPDVLIEGDYSAFNGEDPVMEAALGRLRKTRKGARKPGHRGAD